MKINEIIKLFGLLSLSFIILHSIYNPEAKAETINLSNDISIQISQDSTTGHIKDNMVDNNTGSDKLQKIQGQNFLNKTIHRYQDTKNQTIYNQQQLEGYLEYKNPLLGISIQYPSDWDVDNQFVSKDSVKFTSPYENNTDRYLESVNIVAYYPGSLPYYIYTNTPIEYIGSMVLEERRLSTDFEFISLNKINVNKNTALAITYTYNDPNIGITKALEIIIVGDNRLYDIVYYSKPQSFNMQLPKVENMLDSLELLATHDIVQFDIPRNENMQKRGIIIQSV